MFKSKKNFIITIFITLFSGLLAGCGAGAALYGNLTTETPSEKVTSAEFKLAGTEGKIAILVNQPGWIKSPTDLRIALQKTISKALIEKAKIKKDRLIEYSDIVQARRELSESEKDEPNKIAAKLNAQYVLNIQIMDFDLSTFAERDFFNGMLTTSSYLVDANGVKLWPGDDKNSRVNTVSIEDEKGTIESSVARLTAAMAHCISRYLYDCKTVSFRVPEEQKDINSYDF